MTWLTFSKVHFPVEIWQEIIKYLAKPELHIISRISVILRNVSLPFLFRTVRFDAKDSAGLRQLAEAYVYRRAVCKNITELHLDYKKALGYAKGKFWATLGVMCAEAVIYTAIEHSQMSRLTTLVFHEVTLTEHWVHSVLKCRTLRRLHLHTCWCEKLKKPFPPATVREFVIQDIDHSPQIEALVTFLSPQLRVLEVRSKDFLGFPLGGKPLPTVFPETCPQLQKYLLRLPNSRSRPFIASLREFLIRTPTIEILDLRVGFDPETVPLPSSALPNLRHYDATLSTGFLATHFINGPRKLALLRIRDDFIRSYDLSSLHNSLHVPYKVSALQLTLQRHNSFFIPTRLDRDLPNIKTLYLNMRVFQPHLFSCNDPNVCNGQTALESVLSAASEFIKCKETANPVQVGDDDCSKRLGFRKLKKVHVDIDLISGIETTPPAFEKWFHDAVTENCPALKEAYFRVWEMDAKGLREAPPAYWAKWRMGNDGHWYYELSHTSKPRQESA